MVYRYKKMISDIKQDLDKYVTLYPTQSDNPPNMLKVLLHSPGFYVIASYRVLYWLREWQKKSGSRLVKILSYGLRFIVFSYWEIAMKTQIQNWPEIGPGLYLSNKGGIIMGPKRVGSSCIIHHNVTIGMNLDQAHPDIGNNIWIGPNSIIFCQIIKDNVIVQSDTVVGKNVPACVVIKGNPGVIVQKNIDKSSLLSNFKDGLSSY